MHDLASIDAVIKRDRPLPAERRSLRIILNPAAGQRQRRRLHATLEALRALDCPFEVWETDAPGAATRLARQAAETDCDLVVAAGGDGTVNEVINGLRETGGLYPQPPLAVLPLGTANVLAAELGLGLAPRAIAATIARGEPAPISLGSAACQMGGERHERVFIMMAGAGFDAHVVENVNLAIKRAIGKGAYVLESLRQGAVFPFAPYDVTIDGRSYRAASVVVANGRHYGGKYLVAPAARLGDPGFQVCLFERGGRVNAARYALALLSGRLPGLPDVTVLSGREIRISGRLGEAMQGDGDVIGRLPVTITALPDALRLVMPPS